MATFPLPVPGYRPLAVTLTHDWTTGTTRYDLHGGRFDGVITLTPYFGSAIYQYQEGSTGFPLNTDRLQITFGDPAPHQTGADLTGRNRIHRPTVNGVQLHCTAVVTLADANLGTIGPVRTHHLNLPVRRDPDHTTTDVPTATRTRITSVVTALLRHWAALPADDLTRLRTAAARQVAPSWHREARAALRDTQHEIIRAHQREQWLNTEVATLTELLPTPSTST